MKRLPLLVLVALSGIALGAGATKLASYPYVPAELNAPCGKTMLEWNLMAGRIEAEPVPLNTNFDLVRLVAEPKPEGIVVRAYIVRAAKPVSTQYFSASAVKSLMQKRFGLGTMEHRLYLLTYLDDRLVKISGNGKYHSISPDATPAEQLAALATIMSHAQAPQP